ncbi:hypothetical protein VCHA43P273_10248 [Vibrio chagasii]|nr:hypothetical protein VCHA36P161_20087 [Vibrio chagasii]CAH6899114.1 hypothetical protein VCHA34P121_30004 [Vibrio chagasii]CAH7052079.1 hypothetical protein VCHA43P273_10248 [Vibrio chagasii]CAH7151735.1 hypothetical protein VCHA52P455_290005 [Vibrio chagasii]CAH7272755.1 hypothetical protein VCHA54P501_10099 [Vibrio chagasii]
MDMSLTRFDFDSHWMLPLYVSTADNCAIKFNSLRVVELKCFRSLVLLVLVYVRSQVLIIPLNRK